MLTFTLAVVFLMITPGPGVLSLAGVGAAFGYREGARYMTGLFIGHNLVSLAVVTGLAAIMLAHDGLRTVLGLASAAYLLFLAYKIAFAGAKVAFIIRPDPPGIKGGALLQVINPKAYAVNTTLFSGFTLIGGGLVAETVLKFLIMNAIWFPIHVLWLYLGIRLRQLNLSERAHRIINIAMSLSMLAVVALAFGAFLFDLNGD